jgi:hypothetical protein
MTYCQGECSCRRSVPIHTGEAEETEETGDWETEEVQHQLADFGISPGWNAHAELRAERQRSARESGRQVECPYRVAGKASALGAGSDVPQPVY